MIKIMKSIKKNFVDSDHFYDKNRLYFVGAIVFTLLQAMQFNNCADIPTLFFFLMMFSVYTIRKSFTKTFLRYTFFVIYFVQVTLSLKLINLTLVHI